MCEWSPRVGFNWDIGGNGTQQIRGGVGMFAGRPPYVWISNQFGNTGIDFTRIGAATAGEPTTQNRIPFMTDSAEPAEDGDGRQGRHVHERDRLIDPDFKYPSVLRGNLGYDRQLPWWLNRRRRLRAGRTPSTTSSTRT